MTIMHTDLGDTRERARELRFEPTGSITETNVQTALVQATSSVPTVPGTAVDTSSSPYAVAQADTMLYVDSTAGPVQILLQTAAVRANVPLSIKDVGGHGSTNNITITPSGADTIDGLPSLVINADFGGYRINPRSASATWTLAP